MNFKVRCKKYLAKDMKWLLVSGSIYTATLRDENTMDILDSNGGIIVSLPLKEFHYYCEIISKI